MTKAAAPGEQANLARERWVAKSLSLVRADFERIDWDREDAANSLVEKLGEVLAVDLEDNALSFAAADDRYHQWMREQVKQTWGFPLQLARAVMGLGAWIHEDVQAGNRARPVGDASEKAIVQLHARALQIAIEALTLIEAGHRNGATALWRSLYEVEVLARVIGEGGHAVGEAYLDHLVVDGFELLPGSEPSFGAWLFDDNQIEAAYDVLYRYNELRTQYPKKFFRSYGWAYKLTDPAPPTFRGIEALADAIARRDDYWRANNKVHAGAYGVRECLSRPGDYEQLFIGPDVCGLHLPSTVVLRSLASITSTLLWYCDLSDGDFERARVLAAGFWSLVEMCIERFEEAAYERQLYDSLEAI